MNQAVIRILVTVVGIVLAVLLASILAEGNFLLLLMSLVAMAATAYIAIFWKYTLMTAWLALAAQVSWYPAGIQLSWEELAYSTPMALAALTIWRLPDRPPELPQATERAKQLLVSFTTIWAVYLAFDFGWRILEIRSYGEPGLKNVIKSYFTLLVPAFLVIYYAKRPALLSLPRNPDRWIMGLLLAGTTAAILARGYQSYFGGQQFDHETGGFTAGPLIIFGVNIVESVYALRTLAPLAVLVAGLFLTRPESAGRSPLLPGLLLFMGFFGAVMSGGRATVVICFAIFTAVLILRRWFKLLIVGSIAALSFVLLINAFPMVVEDVGGNLVSRSVSWLIFSDETVATSSIDSSSRWRTMIFQEAIAEWTDGPRNFLIGRGYQGFSESDSFDLQDMGYYDAIRLSLQRGVSHSLVSDCLLLVGVIGLFLFYSTIIFGLLLGWRAAHERTFSPLTRDIAWILVFTLGQRLTIGSIGGGLNGLTTEFIIIATLLVSANRDHHDMPPTEAQPLGESEESTYATLAA